ncbi:MAG: PD-(D/E)XK nuclease domain-containing protein [Paludibacteraceae bacterium]|nr:PD-(D/E)XK nuclease domain-containing protein [Paludibacteraceae bacterium]
MDFTQVAHAQWFLVVCQSAESALSQIDEKRCAKKISASDKAVVKIGANFSTKERKLTERKVVNS